MTRIIKFRAWDKQGCKMVNPFHVGAPCDSEGQVFSLMQFTGMSDKHGKEVYEGDIVKIVSWENTNINRPSWEIADVRFSGGTFRAHAYNAGQIVQHSEIIGNIYQNKSLIK